MKRRYPGAGRGKQDEKEDGRYASGNGFGDDRMWTQK